MNFPQYGDEADEADEGTVSEISSVESEDSDFDENSPADADIDQSPDDAASLVKGRHINSFQLLVYYIFIHAYFRYLDSYT